MILILQPIFCIQNSLHRSNGNIEMKTQAIAKYRNSNLAFSFHYYEQNNTSYSICMYCRCIFL